MMIGAAAAALMLVLVVLVGFVFAAKRKKSRSAVAAPPPQSILKRQKDYVSDTPGLDNTGYTSETEPRVFDHFDYQIQRKILHHWLHLALQKKKNTGFAPLLLWICTQKHVE